MINVYTVNTQIHNVVPTARAVDTNNQMMWISFVLFTIFIVFWCKVECDKKDKSQICIKF